MATATEQETPLSDLPGGNQMTEQFDANDPTQEHLAELAAREQENMRPNTPRIPAGTNMGLDDRGDPYATPLHGLQAVKAKQSYTGMLMSRLQDLDLKQPILVAVLSFVVHQPMFQGVLRMVLPTVVQNLMGGGLVTDILSAIIVGVLFILVSSFL